MPPAEAQPQQIMNLNGKPKAYRTVRRQKPQSLFKSHRFGLGDDFGVALGWAEAGGGLAVDASGFAVESDFKYATTCNNCSSLIWP